MIHPSVNSADGRSGRIAIPIGTALLLGILANPSQAADYLVSTTSDEPYDSGSLLDEMIDGGGLSLREAIALANGPEGDDDGDTIAFDPVVFLLAAPTITLGAELVVGDDVVINGSTPTGPAILDGGGATRILHIDTGSAPGNGAVSIANLVMRGGSAADDGGGIRLAPGGSLTLTDSTIDSCSAADGGGIHNDGGHLMITGGTFTANVANAEAGSGGAIFNASGGKVTIEGASFVGNLANRAGGAIEDQSGGNTGIDLSLSDVTFTDNKAGVAPAVPAPGNGGAIHITGSGSIRIDGGSASGNQAGREGGAYWNGSGTMEIVDSSITANSAAGAAADDGGGGVFNNGGTLVINGGSIASNFATGASGSGGGVFSTAGTVTITGTTLSANQANRAGGAIEVIDGVLDLDGVTLGGDEPAEGNIAGPAGTANPGNGGGIHISGSTLTVIDGGLIGFNVAAREGGGLWNQANSSMTVRGGTEISDNIALGMAADDGGGGIFNNGGELRVIASGGGVAIARNTATEGSGSGGGVFNASGGTAEIRGATLSQNVANRAGGAIEDASGLANGLAVIDSTLSGNLAGVAPATAAPGNGGGVHITGSGGALICNGSVTGNRAASEGGGLWNGTGTMEVEGAEVSGNTASGNDPDQGGGGIFNAGGSVSIHSLAVIDGNLADGTAGSGGGVLNDVGGTVTIEDSTLSNNACNRAGGGIEDNSGAGLAITLTNVTMTSNNTGVAPAVAAPGNGGALHVTGPGDVSVTGGTISGNLAAREGGGLWNGSGTMTVDGTSISGNTASGAAADDGGGGIFNNGGTLVVGGGSSLFANVADGDAGSGGGILTIGGTVSIENSTISDNRANRAGGGIEDASGAGLGLTLTNVTMMSNNAGVAPAAAAPGNGGALHVSGAGDVMITGGTISGNLAALEGGGLWNGSGTMTVDGSAITSNEATGDALDDGGGGIFNNGGILIVRNGATIDSNAASGAAGSGGGILNVSGGSVTVSSSSLSANRANRAGGGIEDQSGSDGIAVRLSDVTFMHNNAGAAPATASPGNGGALHVTGSGGVEYTAGLVAANEAAAEGGGLWNGTGTMTIDGVTIENNRAHGDPADQGGGGVFNAGGSVTIVNSTLAGNVADGLSGSGGGILNDAGGMLEVANSTLDGNVANRAGGALEVTADTTSTFDGCTVTGNIGGPSGTANPGNGGAVHISGSGSVEATASSFTGNEAGNEGGGLWNSGAGTLTIARSAIVANSAPDGGGLFNQAGSGQTTVSNTTVSGNLAQNGAGIRIEGGTMDLLQVTVAANTADAAGGGIDVTAGALNSVNSLVADNTATTGPDVNGSFTAVSFTLVEDAAGSSGIMDGSAGNIVGTDPMLTALTNNGGPTASHRPLDCSIAVDAGDNTAAATLPTDQRGSGFARLFGPAVDLGAIEVTVFGYAAWADASFTAATPLDQRDPGDDPDLDGIANAFERLMGSGPESAGASPIRVMTTGTEAAIGYPRSKSVPKDTEFLETSTNLFSWDGPVTPALERMNLDADTEWITLTVPTAGEDAFFLRLNAP